MIVFNRDDPVVPGAVPVAALSSLAGIPDVMIDPRLPGA
jgi:hypothetical protein